MPIPLTNEIKSLLDGPNFDHLATLMPDGSRKRARKKNRKEQD